MWRRTRSGIGSAGDAVERKRATEHDRVVLAVDSCDRDVRRLGVFPAHVAELGHQRARALKLGLTTRIDGLPRRKIFQLGGVEFLPLGVCGWDTWWFCVALRDRWWFCAVLRRRTAETANAPAAVRVAAPAAAAPAAAAPAATRMALAAEATGTCSSCGACTTDTYRRTMCYRLRRAAAAAAAAAPVMAAAAVAGASCAATLSGNLRRNLELLVVVGGTIVVDATLARCRCDGSLGPQSGCLLGRFDFVVVCEACANGRYFIKSLVRSVATRTTHLCGVSDALRCVHSCESQGSAGFRTRHPETFRTAPLQSFREAQRPALPARNPASGPSATSSAHLRHL